MPFVPDQLVKCVRTPEATGFCEAVPTEGRVYTVRETRFYADYDKWGVRLVEIVNAPRPYANGFGEAYFMSECFRPIDDKALDIFRQVLTDAPKDVETV